MASKIKIFVSYAHRDESLLKKLKMHLKPLLRQGLIDLWYDRNISAGADWEREIDKHLETAQIILLLVSPDFIDSDYCHGIEVRRAKERHERGDAIIIPTILRPIKWQWLLGDFQALPTSTKPVRLWRNQDEAFLDVANGIQRVVDKLIARRSVSLSPPKPTDSQREASVEPEYTQSRRQRITYAAVWPTIYEYDAAFRDASTTVYDADVKAGKLSYDSRPLRLNLGSKYVSVYKMSDWVVKCFFTNILINDLTIAPPPDIRERYQAINDYISQHRTQLPFLVPQIWVEKGIKIDGQGWPFIKSKFIQAPTLGVFLADRHQESFVNATLAKQWLEMINTLEALNMAHGDLNITNVLVCDTFPNLTLRLVDFDSMYVPTLEGRTLYELGDEHFQPIQPGVRRFNNEMDRFSALVIYLSLIALDEDTQLWDRCKANEDTKLLLGSDDFRDLGNSAASKLLRAKRSNRELQQCLDELERSILEQRMPRSLADVLQVRQSVRQAPHDDTSMELPINLPIQDPPS